MLQIYFDDVLIDNDYYTYLDNDYKLFDDNTNFRLGATACNTFKLSVDKSVVSSHPNEVKIDDGTSTFYLIVDSIEEDKFTYTYTLVDKLMLFNFYYDASEIIEEKASNEEDCYLSDILQDMCEKAGVELDPDYEFQNDIVVNWYDNRKQAREYLSYIAELQYGYAQINEYGKLTFKRHNSEPVKTINIDECDDFILGEGKTISRVVYDNGLVKYEFGDDSGATLYLNPNNVYIINEEIAENIYNELVGFTFYNVSVPQCPIDSSVKAGDVIVFTDGVNNYPTIAQYSLIYNGGWTGGYSISVNTNLQQETQIIGVADSVLSIRTELDRTNAELKITAQQTDENSSQLSEMYLNYQKIEQTVRTTGGSNAIKDSAGLFGLEPLLWTKEGNVSGGFDQSLIGRCVTPAKINIQNGKITSTISNIENLIVGNTYTLSFLVINDENTTLTVKLTGNNEIVNLEVDTEEDLKEYVFNFIPDTDKLTLEIESESLYGGSSSIVDLMLNLGEKKPHELANGEINGANMQISAIGTVFRNINADTVTLVNSDGFDIREYYDGRIGTVITDFRKDGMNTKKVGCTEIKMQKLVKKTINSNGREIYIEYIEGS